MANIKKIKLPNGTEYDIKDSGALPLTGGTVTGPVIFQDTTSMDEATIGNLIVNGNLAATNNIQANTINGVTVGSSPKFTDTITTATTSGSGNAVTAISASSGALTVTKGSTFLTSSDISGKIDTAGTGLSKSGTTLNHSNSVTAQTTQAVYPIKIDAQGHISAYGSAVTSMPASDVYSWAKASSKPTYTASEVGALASNTTYVSTVTTTAGTHTAISSKSGAVSFNVPTKTSHLTNDSGFITSFTDTKLQVAAVTSGTTYYPIVGTGTTAATRQYDTTGFVYVGTNGTTSAVGSAKLTLGNSTASGTANNKQGQLIIYGSTAYAHTISGAPTAARTLTLPNATGTIALTSDIPDVSGKIDTAGTGLSKSGTTLNHSNSVTAQTTQAIYPIKIDAQGHISSYGTAVTPLISHQTIKQDAVTGATGNHYASCTTDAGTAAKTASITAGTPSLEAGLRVSVKFSNANTAGTPTLNINSLGAKNIFHKGAQITTGSNKALLAGLVDFIYDGTQWHLVGNYLDTNTTYTASTTSIGSASAGTAISADDITAWTTNTPTAVTKKTVVTSASGATATVSNGVLTLTNGSFSTGDSVTVTAGTSASLSYTARSIPNISVTSKTVATGITAN